MNVHTLATLPSTVDGLSFRQGYVLFDPRALVIPRAKRNPTAAVFEYADASDQGSTFELRIVRLGNDFSQKMDPRPISKTPGGRPVRVDRVTAYMRRRVPKWVASGVVFYDGHLVYVAIHTPGWMNRHQLTLAERLVDRLQTGPLATP